MILFILGIFILCLVLIKKLNKEHFPFLISSPPKRNMSHDIRCDPYIPHKNISPWHQSTIDYYYRTKCLELI